MVTEAATSEALLAAIRAGETARAQDILEQRPELASAIGPDGLSALMTALYHNQSAIAQTLLTRRAAESLTVHEAAAVGALPRLEELVTGDPSLVNAWSVDGFQPLGLAAFFGQPAAVSLLLERGAEVNTRARHQFGVAAIHAALAGPTPEVARALVAAGADVNATQSGGETPLHETAFSGYLELSQFLLDQGADRTARNDQGRTPADVARERGHAEVAALLD
ncbi:MAG TPA: ankyrin repeat domain-containing protein [Chloroflexota bacterium]|jgi:ankyrin repeat protein|nr:ankyrin repeat domain-containing protein [Chloroflexota bacterium]